MPCSPPTSPHWGAPRCQVPGCTSNLSSLRAYYLRYHICEQHSKADEVLCEGEPCRFCQLCGRFHPLGAFNSGRRSCKERLAKHNARRKTLLERKANSADGGYGPSAKAKKGRGGSRKAKATDTDYDSGTDCDSVPTLSGRCDRAANLRDQSPEAGGWAEDASDGAMLQQQLNLRSLVVPSAAAGVRRPTYLAACRPYVPSPLSRAIPLTAGTFAPTAQAQADIGTCPSPLPSAMPSLLDLNGNKADEPLCVNSDRCAMHAHGGAEKQQQRQARPFACQHDACDDQAALPSRSPHANPTSSGRSQQSAASAGHANSACSSAHTGCSEASDMDTECGEPGLMALWRQWGGDDCNLIVPTISNLMAINLAPSTQHRSLTHRQSL